MLDNGEFVLLEFIFIIVSILVMCVRFLSEVTFYQT
jgi:hypothetical protein